MIVLPDGYYSRRHADRLFAIRRRVAADWYFKTYEFTTLNKVVWVPSVKNAMIFTDIDEVELFKDEILLDRTCDIIELEH